VEKARRAHFTRTGDRPISNLLRKVSGERAKNWRMGIWVTREVRMDAQAVEMAQPVEVKRMAEI